MWPIFWKIFDYIINRKLDNSEIVHLEPTQFPNVEAANSTWKALKASPITRQIDQIYRKHNLDLPPFSSWKATDLNKGPSDRGELEPDPAEYDVNLSSGQLSKVRYDAYGTPRMVALKEVREVIRGILEEAAKKGIFGPNNLIVPDQAA